MHAYHRQSSGGRRIAALCQKRRTVLRPAYSCVASRKHTAKLQNNTAPSASNCAQTMRTGTERARAVKKMLEESTGLGKRTEREIFYWSKEIGAQNTLQTTNTNHSHATRIFYEQSCAS